jgi:hypothetical protein
MMADMRNAFVAAGIFAGLIAACAPHATRVPDAESRPPANYPEAYYREVAARGSPVFRVEPASSLVVIEVRRGGSLARLGHDHVVASHDVQGLVAPGEGRSDLYVALDRLVVDEPALRAEAKLDTQPTDEDIAGTRHNMLNTLQANEFPFALVNIARGDADGAGTELSVTITLHGTSRTMRVPVQIDVGADEVRVDGGLSLRQTDFGIKPLSVLGGAVQVQDLVDLRFRIRALRILQVAAGLPAARASSEPR